MASNSTGPPAVPDITQYLPPSLNLPPHLSAHKYFFVCTLTVAAWDTLVLSPRWWRLLKTPEHPPLKIIFNLLRFLMPIEFTIVAVAFFNTSFTQEMCKHFYLFEPIMTAVLLTLCAATHAIRLYAIYGKNMTILGGLGAAILVQVAAMAVSIAFFKPVPLLEGQGCIAGPQHNWVGIYWAATTAYFTITFALALTRSIQSLQTKPLSAWKLMLRDGLNLYGAIWIVNVVNTVFWFVAKETNERDTIKTIVTSMAAVLTTTMTLRIILGVRGSLVAGGSYAGSSTGSNAAQSRGTTHVISTGGARPGVVNINASQNISRAGQTGTGQAFTLEEMRAKAEQDWIDGSDGRSSLHDGKEGRLEENEDKHVGVKVTIDREIDYRYK